MIIAKSDKAVTERLDKVTGFVVKYLCEQGITIATAESCTGGLLSFCITSVPGASKIFELGMCTYSERAKRDYLGVDGGVIEEYGVYSSETATAMARAVRDLSGAQIGVGITGIAGPQSDEKGNPAGTVFVSAVSSERELVRNLKLYERFEDPTREVIRTETAVQALCMVAQLLGLDVSEVNV